MGTNIDTSHDVISFLRQQHEEVRSLLERVIASRGEVREAAFVSLRRMLAVHEIAEEEVLHPVARRALPDGEAIVAARLEEERLAKKALLELEALPIDSTEFTILIQRLKIDVLSHAESEEKLELDRLRRVIEPKQLIRMKRTAQLAEAIAPTRPHPGIESAARNFLVGPFVSVVDRARDRLARKS